MQIEEAVSAHYNACRSMIALVYTDTILR